MTNEEYLDWQTYRGGILPVDSAAIGSRSSVCNCCATMLYSFLPTFAYEWRITKQEVLEKRVKHNIAMVSIQDSNSPIYPKLYTDKKSVHLTIKDGNNITTMEWPIL